MGHVGSSREFENFKSPRAGPTEKKARVRTEELGLDRLALNIINSGSLYRPTEADHTDVITLEVKANSNIIKCNQEEDSIILEADKEDKEGETACETGQDEVMENAEALAIITTLGQKELEVHAEGKAQPDKQDIMGSITIVDAIPISFRDNTEETHKHGAVGTTAIEVHSTPLVSYLDMRKLEILDVDPYTRYGKKSRYQGSVLL
ncbi:hypothetical protein HAX54_049753 [Datura stramonium]|uniref:Uncharacterized protein n=1 Tax=Datura stramonium TaxID=4076 RepID=A0ABS8SVX7_DATST|nr:hypothetical protein [Datura stramonium]